MIQTQITLCQNRINSLLTKYFDALEASEPDPSSLPLLQAMRYGCLNGGKRLRPLLVYTTAALFGGSWEQADAFAVAIELIHCYSLIHDDLPIMDNDDLRRGQPTCHKVFGEATALLAGNALLNLAMEILAAPASTQASAHLLAIQIISHAAGAKGMLKGQMQDLAAENHVLSLARLKVLHQAKTGALIVASVQCGAIAAGQTNVTKLNELKKYAEAIGLGFQIQDDILDLIGTAEIIGKQPGQDMKRNKSTFVTLLGLAEAKENLRLCHQAALACLAVFGERANDLRDLTVYLHERIN